MCRKISIPFPTHRLSSSALRALSVDTELSPLVCRSFSLIAPGDSTSTEKETRPYPNGQKSAIDHDEAMTVLCTEYKAATNRMLRVAVNGFMESLGVVLGVMEELDIDTLVEGLS